MPVVVETRPGVYRKNAWVSHIYGVRPHAARYQAGLRQQERDSFTNLLLLCLPHHEEVDDEKTGEQLYPPELLRQWKTDHEGSNGPLLAQLGAVDPDQVIELLTAAFTPPLDRLEVITKRLEQTGVVTAETVSELRQVLAVMATTAEGADTQTARSLSFAADVFSSGSFHTSARQLALAAEILPGVANDLRRAAAMMS